MDNKIRKIRAGEQLTIRFRGKLSNYAKASIFNKIHRMLTKHCELGTTNEVVSILWR